MEVKKSTKEIPIHSNSFINHTNNNYHPSSSPPLPSPNTTEKKSLTLDPSPSPSPSPKLKMIKYRECQRNHAAHLGSHVVDGCGEFMPSGEGETPLALKCAACNCHRNFHRREVEGEITTTTTTTSAATPLIPLPPPTLTTTPTANCYISFSKFHKNNNHIPQSHAAHHQQGPHHHNHQPHHQHHHPRAPVMMAFGGAAESSSEDLNAYRDGNLELVEQYQYGLSSKKRYRTKFSQDQKHKMMEFAEKIGWRIQKQDDVEVQRFCNEVGVKRQVFKVWMHNNKQALKKKQTPTN